MNIKAYTLSTCVFCQRLKRFMETHNMEFEYVDVDLLEGEELEAIRREKQDICPGCGYPIIVVDGAVIRGFDEPRLREVLGI